MIRRFSGLVLFALIALALVSCQKPTGSEQNPHLEKGRQALVEEKNGLPSRSLTRHSRRSPMQSSYYCAARLLWALRSRL
jgi:hypothetical protein